VTVTETGVWEFNAVACRPVVIGSGTLTITSPVALPQASATVSR
jgi:hypothetical protein